MHIAPLGALTVRVLTGTAWAGALIIAGLVVASAAMGSSAVIGNGTARWGALALIAAGEFVFLVVVADRLCPMTDRRIPEAMLTLARWTFYAGVLGFSVSWCANWWLGGVG